MTDVDCTERSALDKAKAALTHAAEIAENNDLNDEGNKGSRTDYARLLDIGQIQAQVAQADALTRIADWLDEIKPVVISGDRR